MTRLGTGHFAESEQSAGSSDTFIHTPLFNLAGEGSRLPWDERTPTKVLAYLRHPDDRSSTSTTTARIQ